MRTTGRSRDDSARERDEVVEAPEADQERSKVRSHRFDLVFEETMAQEFRLRFVEDAERRVSSNVIEGLEQIMNSPPDQNAPNPCT